MRNRMFLFILSFILILISSAYSQGYRSDYNPSYGPAPLGSEPQSIARLLSYENFRSIKLLNTAIMNYGGGEAELNKLIDQYAEASALYFENKMMESAKAFRENQIAIMATAKQLAQKYHQDANTMLKDSINLNVRAKITLQMKSGQNQEVSDKCLSQAQGGVLKANDYYDRYKDAKAASAMNLINAIYYYRGAKENMFLMMKVIADSQSKTFAENEVKTMIAKKQLARAKKEEAQREKEAQKKKELLSKYLDKFAKDMADNKNMVYESKEKEK